MKLKSVRARRARRVVAPRLVRPRAHDATMEPDPGPGPEAVFDRITGPYGLRRGYDEET